MECRASIAKHTTCEMIPVAKEENSDMWKKAAWDYALFSLFNHIFLRGLHTFAVVFHIFAVAL